MGDICFVIYILRSGSRALHGSAEGAGECAPSLIMVGELGRE